MEVSEQQDKLARTYAMLSALRQNINQIKDYSVERSFILTKIDAVLGYFTIITSGKPKKMGFTTHQD